MDKDSFSEYNTDLRISNRKNFHRPQSPLFYNPPQSPFYKGGQRGIKEEKKDFPLLRRNSIKRIYPEGNLKNLFQIQKIA